MSTISSFEMDQPFKPEWLSPVENNAGWPVWRFPYEFEFDGQKRTRVLEVTERLKQIGGTFIGKLFTGAYVELRIGPDSYSIQTTQYDPRMPAQEFMIPEKIAA